MKIIYRITETLNKAKNAFKRYPLVMALIILSALCFIVVIAKDQSFMGGIKGEFSSAIRFAYFFMLAAVMAMFVSLFFEGLSQSAKTQENINRNKLIKISVTILSTIFLLGIGKTVLFSDPTLFEFENKYIYFGLLLGLTSGCFFAAKLFYHSDFIAYLIKIFTSAFISVSYSVIMLVGLFSIYFAINKLLGIEISDKIYSSTFVILMMPFNVGIFLSNYPRASASFDNYKLSKPIKALIIYILVPIFVVYITILYLYFAKIIITAEIPQGMIVELVIWFSIFEVMLMFVLGKIEDSKVVEGFKKYFPIIILPIMGMMFYAIIFRIREYGITENRFFVLAAGIFATLSNLYYVFYRKNSNITIPIILAATILISTLGPISAYRVSAESQNNRLAKILEKNNMLLRREVVPSSDISDEDKAEIVQIVEYMTEKHRPWESKYLPNDYKNTEENFEKLFGFSHKYSSSTKEDLSYFYEGNSSIDLTGYSRLMEFELYSDVEDSKTIGNYKVSSNNGIATIEYKIGEKYNKLFSFDMKDVLNKLRVLKVSNETIVLEDLSIKGNSKGIVYKVVFTQLNESGIKEGESIQYMKFYLITGNLK
ncbi:DUF4153 domain-containing protein [Peptoniphilus indolicus]|nr:DUF4153 domain-containing protein [Peptoniphilus indolicus]SUB74490.1 Uncharacterised protein [Peptoniphilus indolicus]